MREMSRGPLRTYKRASAAFSGRDYRDYCRAAHFSRARGLHTYREKEEEADDDDDDAITLLR